MRRLLKTLRELGFPAADLRPGADGSGRKGVAQTAEEESGPPPPPQAAVAGATPGRNGSAAGSISAGGATGAEIESEARTAPALSFAAAALLREYEAWLGEWDEACKRAAMGGVHALDTIYSFARLRSTFPFAPDILDDETLAALRALPWDAHHRALLGFDLEPAQIRDEAERRIGQACAILGDAALAVPAGGDSHTRLLWLQRIATAQGKAAVEALLAALLAPSGQSFLSVATTQSRHGAASVLGRLCERARLPATGPLGGALAALDERHRAMVDARPTLVSRHAGELPQVDWLLPLAIENLWPMPPDPVEPVGPADPAEPADPADPPSEWRDEPLGAPFGRSLRALSETVRRVEDWYTSAAAALRSVAAEHPAPSPARTAALTERRAPVPGPESGRPREEFSPQRAATTVEHARARAQLMREQLSDAAAQIECADSTTWVQVVTTARQLERWLAPVTRGWLETDPSVTPLIREIREQASQIAALTTPPVKVLPALEVVEATLELEPTRVAAADAEPSAPSNPTIALELAAEAAVAVDASTAMEPSEPAAWRETQAEDYELPEGLEPVSTVEAPAAAEETADAPTGRTARGARRKRAMPAPKIALVQDAPRARRRRQRSTTEPVTEASAPTPPRRPRQRKAPPAASAEPQAAVPPPAEVEPEASIQAEAAVEPETTIAPDEASEPAISAAGELPVERPSDSDVVEATVAAIESEPEPAPEPAPPPPPVDWTPQLRSIQELGTLWAKGAQSKSRVVNDAAREQLIGRLNELVWPIVSGGIDPYSDTARTIRQTLEPIVTEANRFAERQHYLAMHAVRDNASQPSSFRARKALREALGDIERGLEYKVPECPGQFRDVREEYDATRNRLMLLRNFIAVKL